MYRNDPDQLEFADFYLPFGGKLSAGNRWVKLAAIVPWGEVERRYRNGLAGGGMGAPAKSGRIAFGALIIKERLGITDEETVEQIVENPYLQYFLGLHEYRKTPLFDPSMMVHFRARFDQADYTHINGVIIGEATGPAADRNDSTDTDTDTNGGGGLPPNEGKLLVDATCTPADITYPTDLKLLNEAREKLERAIDELHAPMVGRRKKPRTHRQRARREYLAIAKKRKPGARKIRVAIGKQLRFIRRDLGHIDKLVSQGADPSQLLGSYQRRCLGTIRALYAQQLEMYEKRVHRVADRIVSISQPHVRPIVRGKAGTSVEFGAKISVSQVKGDYVMLHRLSWDAYNESADLGGQIEAYRERFGHYPESVHADAIYRTRANRSYCKDRGIRLSGKPLGRPKRRTEENREQLRAERRQIYQDEVDRIPIEGKFGNCKRKGTLARVMAKLVVTSVSVINIGLIVLNLDKRLREIFWSLACLVRSWGRCSAATAARQARPARGAQELCGRATRYQPRPGILAA